MKTKINAVSNKELKMHEDVFVRTHEHQVCILHLTVLSRAKSPLTPTEGLLKTKIIRFYGLKIISLFFF